MQYSILLHSTHAKKCERLQIELTIMDLLRRGVAPGVKAHVERLLRSDDAKDPYHQLHLITEALKQPDCNPKAVAQMFRALTKKASTCYLRSASDCIRGAVHYAIPFNRHYSEEVKDDIEELVVKRKDLAWTACRASHTLLFAARLDIKEGIFPRRMSVYSRLKHDHDVEGNFPAIINQLRNMDEIDAEGVQKLLQRYPMVPAQPMQAALAAVQDALGPMYETTFEATCRNVEAQYTAKLIGMIEPAARKPWDPNSWTDAQEAEYHQACLLHNTCMVGLDEDQTLPLLRLRHAMIDLKKQVMEAKAAAAAGNSSGKRQVAIIVRKASNLTLQDGSILRVPPISIYLAGDDEELQAHLTPVRKLRKADTSIVVVRVSSGFGCKLPDCPDVDAIVRFMVELGSGRIDEQRMTFTGSCLWCGRELSAPSSVQRSAGDSCFKSNGRPLLENIISMTSLPATTGEMMQQLGCVSDAELLRKLVTELHVQSDVLDTLRELYATEDEEEEEGQKEKEEMAWSALATIAGVQGGAASMRRAATDVARVVATRGKWIPPLQQGRFVEATKASEHLDGAGGMLLAEWLARRIMQEPIPPYHCREENETLASRLKRMRSQLKDQEEEETLAAKAMRIGAGK